MRSSLTLHQWSIQYDAKSRKPIRVLSAVDRRRVQRYAINYIDRVLAQEMMRKFAMAERMSIRIIRGPELSDQATNMRIKMARHLRSQGVTMVIISELINRDYDMIRYYTTDQRERRKARYRKQREAKCLA